MSLAPRATHVSLDGDAPAARRALIARGIRLCGVLVIAFPLAMPLVPSDRTLSRELRAIGSSRFEYQTTGRGIHVFWLRGADARIAHLSDGRHVELFSEGGVEEGWLVSEPVALAAGSGWLELPGSSGATAGMITGSAHAWPARPGGPGAGFLGAPPAHSSPLQVARPAFHLFGPRPFDGLPSPPPTRRSATWTKQTEQRTIVLRSTSHRTRLVWEAGYWTAEDSPAQGVAPSSAEPWYAVSRGDAPVALELRDDLFRLYVDGWLVLERNGDYQLASVGGLFPHGSLSIGAPAYPLRVDLPAGNPMVFSRLFEPHLNGWSLVRLFSPAWSRGAYLYDRFLASEYTLEASLVEGAGVVIDFQDAWRYTIAECLTGARVLLQTADPSHGVRQEILTGISCEKFEIRHAPGRTLVANHPVRTSADIGRVGCLVRDLGAPHCTLRMRTGAS